MTKEEFEQKESEMADKIIEANKIRNQLKEHYDAMANDIESLPVFIRYESAKDAVREKSSEIASLEGEYKKLCEERFVTTGEKSYSVGSIQETSQLDYYDTDAIRWAIEHNLEGLLSLNRTEFEKLAKAYRLNFVVSVDVPRLTFDRKGISKKVGDK